MILEHVNGEIPDDLILNFINVTFNSIIEAFTANDVVKMRHTAEFFIDVKNRGNQNNELTHFNYHPEILRIINVSTKQGRF